MSDTELHEDGPAIALVGMSGRFPGAKNVEAFWENAKAGEDCVTRFAADELDPAITHQGADYVCAKGMLDDVDMFDAAHFGILPRDAEKMDPQQRIFLEICAEAVEGAGYDPARYDGAVGVYAGCYLDTYLLHNLCSDPGFRANLIDQMQVGTLQTELGNDKDFLATRVAFKLGLRGPAMTLQTACSTSLVAVATACQALESYACDMALAGGVTIVLPQHKGYQYKEGAMLSPDGTCRPFDHWAAGTVFSNGAAVVLLKRLDDALADGDTIHAVIRGYATNNDGAGKVSFTAPSPEGQSDVISLAMGMGGVDARTIGYVEAHGTATPLGDPIEVQGLTRAYRCDTDDTGYCALGSVKASLGHLDVASGAIGLIHAAHCVRDGVIPPLCHYEKPNPKLNIETTPFYLNDQLKEWRPEQTKRRAAISSFGVGGTNAHVVIEEPPLVATRTEAEGPFLFPLSARTPTALAASGEQMASAVANGTSPLGDVAATLQRGRHVYQQRTAVVGQDVEALSKSLSSVTPETAPRRTILVFPGQGAQTPGMSAALYHRYPTFRAVMDQVAGATLAAGGHDVREDVLEPSADAEQLKRTERAQPALYAHGIATAMLLKDMGIHPDALIGHSVGEIAAAVFGGALSVEDGAVLAAKRGQMMALMPEGAMLAVLSEAAEVARDLPAGVSIAAVNAPGACVVAGGKGDVAKAKALFADKGVRTIGLAVSHGFHTPMMAEAAKSLQAAVGDFSWSDLSVPVYSTQSGKALPEGGFAGPQYWRDQMIGRVRFFEAVSAALADGAASFVEMGPGRPLSGSILEAAGTVEDKATTAFALDAHDGTTSARLHAFLSGIGKLWAAGHELNWEEVQPGPFRRVPLPTYPFERKRHWVEPTAPGEAGTAPAPAEVAPVAAPAPHTPNTAIEKLIKEQLAVVEAQLDAIRRS